MSSTLRLEGLDELRRALRDLPEDLTREADAVVRSHADECQRLVQAAYPSVSGNLARGVTVEHNASKFHTSAIVKSRARHAHLFEFGTQKRRTLSGANRGSMPAAQVDRAMLPIVIRLRKRMVEGLITVVEKAGLKVTR